MRFQSFILIIALLFSTHSIIAQIQTSENSTTDNKQYLTIQDYEQVLEQVNSQVSVTGISNEFKPSWAPKAPNVIYLRDTHHTIEIVYWDSNVVGEMVTDDFTKRGTPVYATGLAQLYRGKLQIKIQENKNLSTTHLPDNRLADQQFEQDLESVDKKKSLKWVPFDEIKATQSVHATGCAIVYFRSEKLPLCQKLEKEFLLKPEDNNIAIDCMFFVNMDTEKGKQLAQEMEINGCPALLVLKPYFKRKTLIFKENTATNEVASFLNAKR